MSLQTRLCCDSNLYTSGVLNLKSTSALSSGLQWLDVISQGLKFEVWKIRWTSGNSLTLCLLIVSRYSTVVVLVVEVVVVVVLEVVSASSQQRPVSQLSRGCSIFLALSLTERATVAALQFRYEPLRFDLFLIMRLLYIKKQKGKCTRRKISYIDLHTRNEKTHTHYPSPLVATSGSIIDRSCGGNVRLGWCKGVKLAL